jgi:CRP-like cAMP-binding protein
VLLDGREVATLGPGDVFGEMGLMGSTGRTADVRSGAYCELWTLAAQDLQQVTGVHGVRPDPPPSSTASAPSPRFHPRRLPSCLDMRRPSAV